MNKIGLFASILLLLLTPSRIFATHLDHPNTVWNAAELNALRSARTGTHAVFVAHLSAYLTANVTNVINPANLAGYAMLARLMQQNLAQPDAFTNRAVASLTLHCRGTWRTDLDLEQASDLANAAIAYDVLFDLLPSAEQGTCRANIAASAQAMAAAACANGSPPCSPGPGGWWVPDLVHNHNWVNHVAIGLAGQALAGEHPPSGHPSAMTWQAIANDNFRKVQAVHDLVTDGSWHEGLGYMEFGFESMLTYWLGAVRRGLDFDKTNLLRHVGRYVFYAQAPNHPRISVMTHGDWNWSRPHLVAILRWAAKRFQDPFARAAAERWDLEPRATTSWLRRPEHGRAVALEYIAYDPNVPSLNPAQIAPDVYNEDQQSFVMRSSTASGNAPPDSETLVVGFKAGVHGGRGNHERIRTCAFPGGMRNFGHDHEDDLGLWIYGKGGWQLPEAVASKDAKDTTTNFSSSRWHNTIIIDGMDQLGAGKNCKGDMCTNPMNPDYQNCQNRDCSGAGIACGNTTHPWFWLREAELPLHVSTDHYAFARADGQPCPPGSATCPTAKGLYPPSLGVQSLLRTVGLSREHGGFVSLQDRIVLNTP